MTALTIRDAGPTEAAVARAASPATVLLPLPPNATTNDDATDRARPCGDTPCGDRAPSVASPTPTTTGQPPTAGQPATGRPITGQPTSQHPARSRPPSTGHAPSTRPAQAPAGQGAAARQPRPVAHPRARLVPALSPASVPRASGPAHVVPSTAEERIAVLRVVDRSTGPGPVEPDPSTDAPALARAIALAVVEVLAGRRPVAQLARWLQPAVYERVRMRAELTVRVLGPATAARPPVVRRARTYALEPHGLEASVVVDDGTRVRAVALRLEPRRGGWKTTALEVG